MTNLAQRLLASIENHGKCNIDGVYKLYPHESRADINAAIVELDTTGWVYYRKSQMIDGEKKNIPNVRRSKKQLYSQQNLLDPYT